MYGKPSIWRKGITMKFTGEIFEKATIRGVADYLLYGLAPNHDERDYETRLDDSYKEFEDVALQYDKDGASDLLSLANAMTCENACVYMELGLQAGILHGTGRKRQKCRLSGGEQGNERGYKESFIYYERFLRK